MSDIKKNENDIQENINSEQNSTTNETTSETNEVDSLTSTVSDTETTISHSGINYDDIEELSLIDEPEEDEEEEKKTSDEEEYTVGAWKRPDVTHEETPVETTAETSTPSEPVEAPVETTAETSVPSEPVEAPVETAAETSVPSEPVEAPVETAAETSVPSEPVETPVETTAENSTPSEPVEAPVETTAETSVPSESEEAPVETATEEVYNPSNDLLSSNDVNDILHADTDFPSMDDVKETATFSANINNVAEEMPVTTSEFKASAESDIPESVTEVEEPVNEKLPIDSTVPVTDDLTTDLNTPVADNLATDLNTPVADDLAADLNTPVADDLAADLNTPVTDDFTANLNSPVSEDLTPDLNPTTDDITSPIADDLSSPVSDSLADDLDTPITDTLADDLGIGAIDNQDTSQTQETDEKGKKKMKTKKEKPIKEKKEKPDKEKVVKEKKPMPKPVKIILIIVAIIAVLFCVGWYLIKINKVTSNAILSTILKPEQYYQMIEGQNISTTLESIDNDAVKTMSASNKKSDSLSNNVTINFSENLTKTLSLLFGNYGSLATSVKSLNFKTDSLKVDTKDQSKAAGTIELGLNNSQIISLDVVVDTETSAIYLQVPTVFNRWIKIPVKAEYLEAIKSNEGRELKPEDIETLIRTYLPILTGHFDTVTLNKNTTVTINESKVETKELKLIFTEKNAQALEKELKATLKEDDLLYSYLESYKLVESKKDYAKQIDDLFSDEESDLEVEASEGVEVEITPNEDSKEEEEVSSFPMTMKVYVDNKGTIVSRVAEFNDKSKLTYSYYDSGDVSKFDFSVGSEEALMFAATGNIKDDNGTYSGTTELSATIGSSIISTFSDLSKYYLSGADPTSMTAQDTTKKQTTTDASKSDVVTEDNAASAASKTYKFNLNYKDVQFVNPEQGLFKGTFNLAPNGIKNLTGSSINVVYDVKDNYQTSSTTINALSQEMLNISTTTGKSSKTAVELPEKSIPYDKLTSDVTAQYNALLELNLYTPAKSLMDAMNNPIFTQMIKMYFVKPGYNKFNGKQTAVELKYIATLNPNTIGPIFKYGYAYTKAGKNPGLDKISE